MASLREVARSVRQMPFSQVILPSASLCARRYSSTETASVQAGELDQRVPDHEAFAGHPGIRRRARFLHSPGPEHPRIPIKYNRGPMHPVQPAPASDPISREFVPGPFNLPRLKQTYQSTVASDLMTLTYMHKPPGTEKKKVPERLRSWGDSTPYHANRARRGPRGDEALRLIEHDITFRTIPEITAITVSSYVGKACKDPGLIIPARVVVQAITGTIPEAVHIKESVSQFAISKGREAGAKATIYGHAAYEFLDKCVNLVFPRIKDWPGLKGTTGDSSGNLAFGLTSEDMALFPEVEVNYQMFPGKSIPGARVFVQTTARSDRHARLLFQALGVPFYGKLRN